MESFGKNINNYFNETNQQVSNLQNQLGSYRQLTDNKLQEISADLARKVTEGSLKASLSAASANIQKELETTLKNDHMLRLTVINEAKNSFREVEKDVELRNKAMTGKF